LAELEALDAAANDIFELNTPIIALVGRLAAAGNRLGVFSNTTPSHWEYCTGRFGSLKTVFSVHALSFRLGAMKPAAKAYAAAANLAGVSPDAIFFTDDREENVAAARAAGWDAVVYTSAWELNEALRERGVRINY
jgi:glucose-1-phosphatase